MSEIDLVRLRERTVRHEGLRLKAYNDRTGDEVRLAPPARLTIGYGRNLQDVELELDVAELMLSHDLERAQAGAFRVAPWARALSATRQEILVEMAYQLGERGLSGFRRFLAYAQAGDERAPLEMLDSRWARRDSPSRAAELAQLWRSSDDF